MNVNLNYLKRVFMITAAVLLVGVFALAEQRDFVHQETGEISWVDLKQGKLQLKNDAAPSTGEITEYRITEHETRVTDPTDTKFLTLEDLYPGQQVTIDVIHGKEDRIVKQIIINPNSTSDYQVAYGEIEAIDVPAGTLTLAGRPRVGKEEGTNRTYFVFEPNNIVVMQSPNTDPVQVALKPGDSAKVAFVAKDEKLWAESVTLYSPKVTSTTTTTTTTTTQ